MMTQAFETLLADEISSKRLDGSYKSERVITTPQDSEIQTKESTRTLLNFCSNNYLGLSNHPKVKKAAQKAIESHGFGMSSVRFICGTQDLHKDLEQRLSRFLLTEDTILYNSCFDANGGLFQNLLGEEDVIISASLNHASIIDGVRLSKAKKLLYRYDDMDDLSRRLKESHGSRFKVVVTDGVFSMEGELASLDKIVEICEEHEALLIVDDSHATGFIGDQGRGTAEYFGVHDRVDLFTGTLGKALGGATGGYISGRKGIIEWLRNTSRPYLFSNSMAPALIGGAIKSIDIVESDEGHKLRTQSVRNTQYFRDEMSKKGFQIKEGIHPIVPIMLGKANIAQSMAENLLKEGVYVTGFSYPVVPNGKARIRVQISAIHTIDQIDRVIHCFTKAGKKYGMIQ